jgi:hypothetical protein
LESKKPQQVPIDSEIHFGASTRIYIIRERPQPISGQVTDEKDKRGEDLEGSLLGLPETETELDVRFHMEILKQVYVGVFCENLILGKRQMLKLKKYIWGI